jgi:hypothetical protein
LQNDFKEDFISNILQCFHAIVANNVLTSCLWQSASEDSTNNTIFEVNAGSHMHSIQTQELVESGDAPPEGFGHREV